MAYTARQNLMIRSYLLIAAKLGGWSKSMGGDGARYISPAQNAGRSDGLVCRNCAFFKGPDGCAVVKGAVAPEGLCKLWVIDDAHLASSKGDGKMAGRPLSLEVVREKK
jgi:hypothetical protein